MICTTTGRFRECSTSLQDRVAIPFRLSPARARALALAPAAGDAAEIDTLLRSPTISDAFAETERRRTR